MLGKKKTELDLMVDDAINALDDQPPQVRKVKKNTEFVSFVDEIFNYDNLNKSINKSRGDFLVEKETFDSGKSAVVNDNFSFLESLPKKDISKQNQVDNVDEEKKQINVCKSPKKNSNLDGTPNKCQNKLSFKKKIFADKKNSKKLSINCFYNRIESKPVAKRPKIEDKKVVNFKIKSKKYKKLADNIKKKKKYKKLADNIKKKKKHKNKEKKNKKIKSNSFAKNNDKFINLINKKILINKSFGKKSYLAKKNNFLKKNKGKFKLDTKNLNLAQQKNDKIKKKGDLKRDIAKKQMSIFGQEKINKHQIKQKKDLKVNRPKINKISLSNISKQAHSGVQTQKFIDNLIKTQNGKNTESKKYNSKVEKMSFNPQKKIDIAQEKIETKKKKHSRVSILSIIFILLLISVVFYYLWRIFLNNNDNIYNKFLTKYKILAKEKSRDLHSKSYFSSFEVDDAQNVINKFLVEKDLLKKAKFIEKSKENFENFENYYKNNKIVEIGRAHV